MTVPVIWIVPSAAPATSAWSAGGPPEWSVNSTCSPRLALKPSRSAIWSVALVALSDGRAMVRLRICFAVAAAVPAAGVVGTPGPQALTTTRATSVGRTSLRTAITPQLSAARE